MLAALGTAGLAVAATACFGVAGPAGSSTHRPAHAVPGTRVVVSRMVGAPKRTRATAAAIGCPAATRCHVERVGTGPSSWVLVAARTLTCAPPGGGYRDPARACGALRDLARLEARRGPDVCMCPIEVGPPPTAVGHLGRRRIRFKLDACGLCGLGGRAVADVRILMPA